MQADLAIIGGTGFYRFFADSQDVEIATPFGTPSAPISVATVEGRTIAFLPRHGRHHQYLPSEIPYAANLWSLRSLGVKQVIGFNTVGSLQRSIRRGDFVFCDQYVDRTSGRNDTIFRGPDGAHISAAQPYCPKMRAIAIDAVQELPHRFHSSGTVVVIQGPRFSTRAESKWFTNAGWDVVNMTQYPEVTLAREMEVCYMNLSYVTDYDVAAKEVAVSEGEEIVSHALVIREVSLGEPRIEAVVRQLVRAIQPFDACVCRRALEGARVAR